MTFSLVMNCYVFIEIFEFFKRSVETLCNLHNSLDAFIYIASIRNHCHRTRECALFAIKFRLRVIDVRMPASLCFKQIQVRDSKSLQSIIDLPWQNSFLSD